MSTAINLVVTLALPYDCETEKTEKKKIILLQINLENMDDDGWPFPRLNNLIKLLTFAKTLDGLDRF